MENTNETKQADDSTPLSLQGADKKIIESHKQAAAHLMAAANHHLDAAKHHEEGNHEKAAYSKLLALGHHTIVGEFISDDAKHHAQQLKRTGHNY